MAESKLVRCAIYTRKSTSEGLEKEFNTLDAQREACESYIKSRKHENWVLLPKQYNDGGFTGGNTDRPALQDLLNDINQGEVDHIVLYKIDRLSRSLLDFAQLMKLFESKGVGLVSITQNFDSQSSMGRLTLNMLLSFAQFEREMISERTRDKLSAMRKKGKWLGSRPVIGYCVEGKPSRLVVDEFESSIVIRIFATYLETESTFATAERINKLGYRTKSYIEKGNERGNKPYDAKNIQRILRNHTYIGKVFFQKELYEGEHDAIIDQDTFDRVNAILDRNRHEGDSRKRKPCHHALKGLIRCAHCDAALSPSFSMKRGNRYLFYRCYKGKMKKNEICPNGNVSAPWLEEQVVHCLNKFVENNQDSNDVDLANLVNQVKDLITVWDVLVPAARREALHYFIHTISYDSESCRIEIEFKSKEPLSFGMNLESSHHRLERSHRLKKGRIPNLKKTLVLAHYIHIKSRLENHNQAAIARAFGKARSRISQISWFVYLAPSIQEQILQNPPEIAERLVFPIAKEADWSTQEKMWYDLKNYLRR